jgi:hypothetical protein
VQNVVAMVQNASPAFKIMFCIRENVCLLAHQGLIKFQRIKHVRNAQVSVASVKMPIITALFVQIH